MAGIVDPLVRDIQDVQRNFEQLNAFLFRGRGDPNGSLAAAPGSMYLNMDGGAVNTQWIKESGGTSNTGWVAK